MPDSADDEVHCPGYLCGHRLICEARFVGGRVRLKIVCPDKRCRRFFVKWLDVPPDQLSPYGDKSQDVRSGYQSADMDKAASEPAEPLSEPPATDTSRSRRWRSS